MLAKPSVTLRRRLNATPAAVYDAWTDPEKLTRWFGPENATQGSVRAQMDVRVGGVYQINFATDDGETHQVGGKYREVAPGQRLVFSWAWHSTPERESLVTISIAPEGDGSVLTLTHEQFFDQAAADGHARGWTGTLDKLERMFA